MRYIILDTETTGLSVKEGHKIVEIGLIEMIDFNVTKSNLHFYVNPERDIDVEAQKIHGLSRKFLSNKPKFCDIVDNFLNFIRDDILVIHNASFDIGFLNEELLLCNKPQISFNRVIDTLILAKKRFPGARVSLDALCDKFEIQNSHRNLHGALIDADLLASVFIELNGGKQPNFEFVNKKIDLQEHNKENKTDDSLELEYKFIARKHSLTKEEEEAHNEMIKKIKNPLWNY